MLANQASGRNCMHKRVIKTLIAIAFVIGVITTGANPASGNQINSATVVPQCNGYTITVSGQNLDTAGVTYTVNYTILVTTSTGSTLTINDSIPVFPDSNLNFNASVTKAAGPATTGISFSGTATLVDSNGDTFNTVNIDFNPSTLNCGAQGPPPPCAAQSTNTSNFNGTPINGGTWIWFNANFTARGIPSSGATVTFTNSTIQFTADQDYNLAVPNAQITFSPSASCATTSFDSITNTWMTTVPIFGSDEIFLDGLAFPVPASFANSGGKVSGNVQWSGTFSTSTAGISMQWKWGAAVYSTFTTDYNSLNVKATHSNSCSFGNSDHAGTPEGTDSSSGRPFKAFVIGGARGGGGSNFTGSWSGTISVTPACPASTIFGKSRAACKA
jgi:hypothetical protein